MRAPILQGYGQVQPSKRGLAYLENPAADAGAFGADIARGLGQLGDSLVEAGLQYQQRNDKTERFGALIGLSEFQTQTASQLEELKRSVPPDVTNFPQQANDLYTKLEQQYIARLPPNLQPEFTFRSRQIKQGVMRGALDFQYTQQDAFFKEGLNKEYERAKNAVFATPDEADKWEAHLAEAIQATDLPAAEKSRLAFEMGSGLRAVLYGREVEGALRESGGTVPGYLVDRIIQVESGGNPKASPSTSHALGLGQFIPSTWKAFIADRHPELLAQGDDIQKFRTDRKLGREAVEWYIEQNKAFLANKGLPTDDGSLYLAHFLGPGGAAQLLSADGATPVSAVVGAAQIQANKSILQGKTVAEVVAWANRKMDTVAVQEVDNDPRFADVPLEDRLAIQAGAQRKVDQEIADATAAARAAADAARNALYNDLEFGDGDEADVQAAVNGGLLNDYEDRARATRILEQKNAKFADQRYIEAIAAGGGLGYNTADNERFNNWLSPEMRAGVAKGDQALVNSVILPKIQTLHDIPTDLVGQLRAAARNTDPQVATFALDTLSQIKRTDPAAFQSRVDEALAGDVALWEARKDLMPREQVLQQISGGMLPEERRQRQVLEQEARTILTTKAGTVPHGQELVTNIVASYDQSYRNDPQMPALPWAARGVSKDFETLFIDGFVKFGNEQEAMKYAEAGLKNIYGVTTIGDSGQVFMKLPPQLAGYRPVLGSYDWIDKQVRTEMGLSEIDQFQLVTDDSTIQEFKAWQSAPAAEPPSYLVAVKRDGVWDIQTDDKNVPIRKFFVMTEADHTEMELQFAADNQREILTNELMTLSAQRDMMVLNGQELPDGMAARIDELTTQLEPEPQPVQPRPPPIVNPYGRSR